MEKIKKEQKTVSTRQPRKKIVKKKVATDLSGNVIKTEKNEVKKKKLNFKEHFRKYKRIYILTLSLLVSVLLVFLGYIGIRNYILSTKYGKYEKIMDTYGFSLMYNNETPKSSEKVTKVEMVKMIIASVYNLTEVESIGFGSRGQYEGDQWVETAKALGIIDNDYINSKNFDDVATYKEAIITYLKARSKVLDIPVSSTKEASFKNLQAFPLEERNYINDAVENELIEDNKKRLNIDKDMFKGEFNMLVVKFVEKYNTVAPEGETLVTKSESKPENAQNYPYILYSIDKKVYEYKGMNEGGVDYMTPAEVYKYRKSSYDQIKYRSEIYYNAILNVDYRNINKEKFFETTNEFLRYDNAEEINSYIDYVVNNKIILEGKATVQLPIFYMDGLRFRARIRLEFEVKNSDTDKNILLGDLVREAEVTYSNKKYELYIDAPMGTTLHGRSLLLDMEPIIDLVVSDKEASSQNKL